MKQSWGPSSLPHVLGWLLVSRGLSWLSPSVWSAAFPCSPRWGCCAGVLWTGTFSCWPKACFPALLFWAVEHCWSWSVSWGGRVCLWLSLVMGTPVVGLSNSVQPQELTEADILPGPSATNHKNLVLSINLEIIINLVFQKVEIKSSPAKHLGIPLLLFHLWKTIWLIFSYQLIYLLVSHCHHSWISQLLLHNK